MSRTDTRLPAFKGGLSVPVITYLVVLSILSLLLLVTPHGSPPPILGMVWGGVLVAVAVGAFRIEGVSPRSIFSSPQSVISVTGVLITFWGLYNLIAFSLALGGAIGFEASWSSVAAHPLPYFAALCSSFLFTAIPEELVFRSYFQQKFTAIAGDKTRRTVAGVVVAAGLFAGFHLPRWFLASGHEVGTALAIHLLGLLLMGLTYGVVYVLTRNLWLVALIHATMNYPPVLITMNVPSNLHFVVGVIEYAAIISIVFVAVRMTGSGRTTLLWSQQEAPSIPDN
ncbi:CPBP family glutamic-type intramembrane protease [Halobellus rufus]|uniref:CPBP family glutamic-type intramembrane protease n=1 Tax=Halobellus rufus TaxID=1448860 RepID=UPI000678F641|nr:CPBP family intramembrane glutamic endopeptidase [Halobellus rufus]